MKHQKCVIIDNYDSFTYNLAHLLNELGADVDIVKNDAFDIKAIATYNKIVFSPGPGLPQEAGKMLETLSYYTETKSILGVCLGHQAIGVHFGGQLKNLNHVFHGISEKVSLVDDHYIFDNLPQRFNVARYHSWVVDRTNLPKDLIVTAESKDGIIMAMKHAHYDISGIQFHPESILTPMGSRIVENWLNK